MSDKEDVKRLCSQLGYARVRRAIEAYQAVEYPTRVEPQVGSALVEHRTWQGELMSFADLEARLADRGARLAKFEACMARARIAWSLIAGVRLAPADACDAMIELTKALREAP